MYARQVKGKELTFAVSGLLWNDSLVMIDMNTGSLWSHIYGEAMFGDLKGMKLKQMPAVMTHWSRWKELHPNTTAVTTSRIGKAYYRDFYKNLESFVVGATSGKSVRAWAFDDLLHQPIVNDVLGNDPVLILFDAEAVTVSIYSRLDNKRKLTFQKRDGQLVDQETQSTWDVNTGKSIRGTLVGHQLKLIPSTVSFRRSWEIFFPETEFFLVD